MAWVGCLLTGEVTLQCTATTSLYNTTVLGNRGSSMLDTMCTTQVQHLGNWFTAVDGQEGH